MSVFEKDWFNRNNNYIVQDKTNSIGWDNNVEEYSSFLYSSTMCNHILSDNGLLLNELYELITTLNLSVRCIVNFKDESYTDGNTIVVSNIVDGEESCFKRLDIIFGSTIHECCHCIYSDFNEVIKPSSHKDEIAKHIQNIIEDEIIEEKISMKHQGYANFLGAVKQHYFSSAIDSIASSERINILDEILTVFLLTIRWPEKVNDYVEHSKNKDILEEVFFEIKKCLMSNDMFNISSHYNVTYKTAKVAKEIVDIISRFIDENTEENSKQCAKECCESSKSEMAKYSEAMEKVSSEGDTKDSKIEYDEKIAESIKKFEESEKDNQNEKKIFNVSLLKKTSFYCASDKDKHKYEQTVRESSNLIRLLKECVIENEYKERIDTLHNMRSGNIAPDKLIDAYQGIKNIFDRKTITREQSNKPKYALLILIDESGSMCNLNELCSKLAISIYEAMKDYPTIELFIYGHGDTVTTYISKAEKNKYTLSKIRKQMEQDEAVSYADILKEVHSMTNLPIVTISITDSYYVTDFEKLKNVIKDYRKRGDTFNLIRLLEYDYDFSSENGIDANNELYGEGNWVSIDARKKDTPIEAIKKLSIIMKKNFKRR